LVHQIHLACHLPEAVLNHRQRHRIERHVAPTEITRLPKPSTTAVAPGSMTTVVSGCSTIAGPPSVASLPSEARSKIGVSNQPPLNRTRRKPLGWGSPDPLIAGAKIVRSTGARRPITVVRRFTSTDVISGSSMSKRYLYRCR